MKREIEWRPLLRLLAATVLGAAAWALPELLPGSRHFLLFLPAGLLAGGDVLWGAVQNLLHGELFDEAFLMSLAAVGAFAVGDCPEAVAVLVFYQLGEWLENLAVDRTRDSISALLALRPDTATVEREGRELQLSLEEVAVGETLVIRPGERVPLDGLILSGSTALNAAALTGESLPLEKGEGERVLSGCLNLSGVIRVRAERVYGESTAARILALTEEAAEKKTKTERFITRFARWYTPCVVGAALLLALLPPLLAGQSWALWLKRALQFLVISCPCALVVSVPLAFFAGLGGASRRGILIKGANDLETLAGLNALAFDKTGTLTQGRLAVEAVYPEQLSPEALLELAAAAECYSAHPVAEALLEAHGQDVDRSRVGKVQELAGLGLEAQVDGKPYFVGNGRLMEKAGADWRGCELPGTVIHVAQGREYLGHILIQDQLKPDAAAALGALKALGIRRMPLLSGDAPAPVAAVSKALGLSEWRASLLPGDKLAFVEALLDEGCRLGFVGDGINDAPVLCRADLGIAMGALGSEAAIESADVVLMDDRLSRLPEAIRLARRTLGIVRQNIWFALGVKALLLLLGALGVTSLWAAVFGDVGVLLLCVLNAGRAMRS